MKHANFLTKSASLLLAAGVLWQYQTVAAARAAQVAERNDAVAQVEAYNADILAQMEGAEETSSPYVDGVYEGTGAGFGGEITLTVTIQGGKLTEITVLSAEGEDPAYFAQAESVLDSILAAQSARVDTVSGATYSSGGLIDAAADALEKAVG